jgi:hypothetical protein
MPLARHQRWSSNIVILALCLTASFSASAADTPSVPPVELVRKTVQNEMQSTNDRAKFMFRDEKTGPKGSQTKLLVETRDAMAGMLIAINGKPLTPAQKQAEMGRLQYLMSDPDALVKKKKQEKDDADRTARIMRALPDAFLYQYDGTEPGTNVMGKEGDELIRLKFRPNPKYDPPTRTEQVLTGMQGTILIDEHSCRIAKIDGVLVKDVGFGWGILGHLDRGGRFLVEQANVGDNHWEVTHMNLRFTGKILFFKSLNIQSNEIYTDFRPAPENLTFAQGIQFLKKQETTVAENEKNGGMK